MLLSEFIRVLLFLGALLTIYLLAGWFLSQWLWRRFGDAPGRVEAPDRAWSKAGTVNTLFAWTFWTNRRTDWTWTFG